jgi:DNA modification methylase
VSLKYHIGDTLELTRQLPDASVDLIVTSPPFLALRSYLPADHPDKHREIGSEPTPADFIDTLLGLTAEWGRVLAPHGSICVELGDTYAGGKGHDDGVTIDYHRDNAYGSATITRTRSAHNKLGNGWPLAKSLTGIPTIYPWSLAYGRNLLTGQPSPAGQWRIRNVIVWARPNPPVGALGDKFRPATSYITVACKGPRRYFDLDAVRTEVQHPNAIATRPDTHPANKAQSLGRYDASMSAGAPPLDWHADDHPEDGDWLWKMSTQPYKGSHYATFPMALPKRLIEAMCPLKVCTVCGVPSTRVVDCAPSSLGPEVRDAERMSVGPTGKRHTESRHTTTLGWTDCKCPCYSCRNHQSHEGAGPHCPPEHRFRTGIVLDPFAGSGTTLDAAQAVGRHAIGFDLDDRNADLARERVGMFLEIVA